MPVVTYLQVASEGLADDPRLRAAGAAAMRTAREALAAARAAPEEAARAVKVQQLVERELLARLVASEFGDSLTTSLE